VTKPSRILCAVDFSEPAQAAFRHALALSLARDAELAVVMARPVLAIPERQHKAPGVNAESEALTTIAA
jgi:hypothetical protein